MAARTHEFITGPDSGAAPFTKEWRVRRRFDRRVRLLDIPEDLTGWSVLDIGAWHGYFSFECERRGADRVLAVDRFAWDRFGMEEFLAAHRRLNSRVEYEHLDVHDLDAKTVGGFDLVLFLGVFYHLRNPVAALEQIASVTNRLLICETHVLLPFIHERYPLVPFFPGEERADEQTYDLCGIPKVTALTEMLRFAGFGQVDVKYRPSFRHWKKLKALVTNRPQSGRGIVHARP